jgi:DNA-binding response OmpR family regulator
LDDREPELYQFGLARSFVGIINVIFVEDEPDIRSIVEMAMQLDNSICYKSFADGRSALAFASESRQHFDMALLNFRLPYMTGIELHRQLRLIPILSNIVTTLITAHVLEDDIAIYKSTGIAGYISKPFNPVTLAMQLRAIYEENTEPR